MNRLTSLLFCVIPLSVSAITVQEGMLKLNISDTDGQTDIYRNEVLLISKNHAVFKIDESEYSAPSLTFTGATVSDYSDLFGLGKRVDLVYTNENPKLKATHTYYLYSGQNYLLTELKVEAPDVIASNYMSPLTTIEPTAFLPAENGTNVALIVPYDNDCWVAYDSKVFRVGSTYTSYEAGCLYSTKNNNGLVLGSIEHDNWKTGVVSKVNTPNSITSLIVYGGISDNYSGKTPTTRDQLPHGKVKGITVKSPKVMIGYFDDWRDGMEVYGELNAVVTPNVRGIKERRSAGTVGEMRCLMFRMRLLRVYRLSLPINWLPNLPMTVPYISVSILIGQISRLKIAVVLLRSVKNVDRDRVFIGLLSLIGEAT